MATMVRGAVALALVAAVVAATSAAEADGPVNALISIDVVVVGTPPPGATVTLVHTEGVGYTPDLFPVTLADLVEGPEVVDVAVDGIGHGVYVDPAQDGGADALLGQGGPDALNGGAQRDTCNGGTERDIGTACEVKISIP